MNRCLFKFKQTFVCNIEQQEWERVAGSTASQYCICIKQWVARFHNSIY